MHSLLLWLQNVPFVVWVAESDSIWGFAFVLFIHAVGMGLTAGLAFIICLRLLGAAREIQVSSLRGLFAIFWGGFYINLVTGVILFGTDATNIVRAPSLYVKLLLLAFGLVTMIRLRRFIDSEYCDSPVPPTVRKTAVLCIVLWLGVITAGRLIAYEVESIPAATSGAGAPAPVASDERGDRMLQSC